MSTQIEPWDVAIAKIEQGWCQGYSAVDKEGTHVSPSDPRACAFCAIGALAAALPDSYQENEQMSWRLRRIMRNKMGKDLLITEWNDDPATTKEDVLAMFRLAKADWEQSQAKTEG